MSRPTSRILPLLALPSIAAALALSGCAVGSPNAADTPTVDSRAGSADAVDAQELPRAEGPDENGDYAPEDAMILTVACLQDAGVDGVRYNAVEGSYTVTTETRMEALEHEAASTDCEGRYPIADPTEDWSDVIWRSTYEAEVRTAECYAAQDLPVAETPTLEEFREDFSSDDAWHSGSGLPEMDQAEAYQLAKICPLPGQIGNEIAGQEAFENTI